MGDLVEVRSAHEQPVSPGRCRKYVDGPSELSVPERTHTSAGPHGTSASWSCFVRPQLRLRFAPGLGKGGWMS